MSQRVHCGRLILKRNGATKKVQLPEGGGMRDCTLSHIDMGFDEIHDKLRDLFQIDPRNRTSKLYDFKCCELDTNRYRTFFEYVHLNGLNFRGILLYLCTPADNEDLAHFPALETVRAPAASHPVPVVRQVPQVEADSSTSPVLIQLDGHSSNEYKPTTETLLSNQIVQNLRISSTTSFSNYSFEKALNELIDYLRDVIHRYKHESIFIQLFEYLCTLQGLSSITLDRLKQQASSKDEHEKQFYAEALEKIDKLLRSMKVTMELNKMSISHIDRRSVINELFQQFQQNFNILREQWNNDRQSASFPSTTRSNDPIPSRSYSSTHHSVESTPRTSSRSHPIERSSSSRSYTSTNRPAHSEPERSSSRHHPSDRTSSRNHPTEPARVAPSSSSRSHTSDRTSSATNTSIHRSTGPAPAHSSSSRDHRSDRAPTNNFSSSSRHHSESHTRKQSRALSSSPHRHHRSTTEDENNSEKESLFRNIFRAFRSLSDVLYDLRFRSFGETVKRISNQVSLCQNKVNLSDYQSLNDAMDTITSIEQVLSERLSDEKRRSSPNRIDRKLEESSDKTLDAIKQLLDDFQRYKSKINASKRQRKTRWSPSEVPSPTEQEQAESKPVLPTKDQHPRRIDEDYDDQSSEASHSSYGDEHLMEVARDAFEQRPDRHT